MLLTKVNKLLEFAIDLNRKQNYMLLIILIYW